MRVTFLGAAGTVTGSKYLIEAGHSRILVDCGLYQGFKQLRLRNWAPLPIAPADIDAVVLTHAHIDHSGYLPLLVRNGFAGRVYCTAATQALCGILLPDAGFLEERDAEFANKYGYSRHRPALPLFTEADARACLPRLTPVEYGNAIEVGEGVHVTLQYAGHLLGAATVLVAADGRRILFSGDLGRDDDVVMRPPAVRPSADCVVVESTYGDREHPRVDPEDALAEIILRTAGRGGTVLIPTFAVGRSQTVLLHLHRLRQARRIPELPIFLDSPMAIDATGVFEEFRAQHRLSSAETRAVCSLARFTRTAEDSKALDANRFPSVILAASGMATGGRVLHHLHALAPDRRNAIVLAGFQAPGTRGAALQSGAKQIKLHGAVIPVDAEVISLANVSSHADASGVIRWLAGAGDIPGSILVTHGEPAAADALRYRIEHDLRWNAKVPAYRDIVEL